MWKITAKTTHGKTLSYTYPTRDRARKAYKILKGVPFLVSTNGPTKAE